MADDPEHNRQHDHEDRESAKPKPSPDASGAETQTNDEEPGSTNGGVMEEDEPRRAPMSPRKKAILLIGASIVVALLVIGGLAYRHNAQKYENTDDAFIDGNQSKVSVRVGGQVQAMHVSDNDVVKAGQPLFDLDPRDLQVRLEQQQASAASAAAQASQARADLVSLRADLRQNLAQVRVADADLIKSRQDLGRYTGIDAAAIAGQDYDQATAAVRGNAAKRDGAIEATASARAQLPNQNAKIRAAQATYAQALAAVKAARLQLGYTHIVAPQDGRVTQRSVNLGDYVNPGQALLAVVPERMWVTANFKETQLRHMRVGQHVEITVDAYPDVKLSGRIQSLQSGTGSFFSTLPAQNATGNYVKVVQRVPVKIVFDGDDWRRLPLAPGLSVSPRVTVKP